MKKQNPPKFFQRLFKWLCKSDHTDELIGDLEEAYFHNLRAYGPKYAARQYRKEVILLLRPSAIRIPIIKNAFMRNQLLLNHIKLSFRHIRRTPLFSFINILGLSISMAIGLLIIAFVMETHSYDQFHEKGNKILRIANDKTYADGELSFYATTSLLIGQILREDYGYEKVTRLINARFGVLEPVDSKKSPIEASGLYTDQYFLQIFSFPLLEGDPETALEQPNSIVITEELAVKLFDKTDVVGETLLRRDVPHQITGILKSIPSNSHLKFEALVSLSTLEGKEQWESQLTDWRHMWTSYVYVEMPENSQTPQLQSHLNEIARVENKIMEEGESIQLTFEKLFEIAPSIGRYNQQSTLVMKSDLKVYIILGIIVLISACFNYANLSIARSLKRAREVGIRKVAGADSGQIVYQFLIEAIMMALLAVVFAFLLFLIIRPEFLELNMFIKRTTTLSLSPMLYLYFFIFAIIIGFLSGLVPAVLVAKFGIVNSIKGISQTSGNGMVRKIMIGIQFVFSMSFTILVIQNYRQYEYALNFDLGFDTENVLTLRVKDNDPELLKSAFMTVPEVSSVTLSSLLPSTGGLNSDIARVVDQQDSMVCYSNRVDRNYLETMGHKLLAGANFTGSANESQMIVNEQFVEKFKLGSPVEALGTRVRYFDDTKTIVGVVEDFHYGTVWNELLPFTFVETEDESRLGNMSLKVASTDWPSTLEKLDEAWSTVDPNREFEATFYDEQIRLTYDGIQSRLKTLGMLAVIAIIIGLLGLLGMAVYQTESRKKELTIRKVLGAGVSQVIMLLSRSFAGIFIISLIVSVALSNLLINQMILLNAKYAVDINLMYLVASGIPIAILALLIIVAQGSRAVRANIVENLRDD